MAQIGVFGSIQGFFRLPCRYDYFLDFALDHAVIKVSSSCRLELNPCLHRLAALGVLAAFRCARYLYVEILWSRRLFEARKLKLRPCLE